MLQQNLLHFYSPQTAQYRSSLRRSWNETSFSKPPSVLAVETDSGEWGCIYGQSMSKVHTIMCTQNTHRSPGPMELTMTMVMGAHNLQDWLNKCTKIRPAGSFFFFFAHSFQRCKGRYTTSRPLQSTTRQVSQSWTNSSVSRWKK